eukprot:s2257_g6.t1
MHKLRRDCDMGEIKQMLEQVDSSRMLRAIRECKVSSDDLAPVLEEVRRLAEEVRQARTLAGTTNREAQQAQTALQDEVSSVKMELRSANRDVSQALSAIKDGQIGIDQVWKEFSVLKEALKQMSQQAVEEIRSVRTAVASMTSTVLEAVDLAPMISEIQAVRSKAPPNCEFCSQGVEVSSALKRQGDQMTKSDFAIALEELRGHFSLLLNSFREVCDQSNAGPSSRTCEQLLQSMRDQRKLVEPLSDLRQKLRDTQSVLGQAGTRHEEAMMRAKASARMSPDCQTEPIVTPWEPVAREPVAPGEPRTQEASAAKSSNFANVSFRG